MIQEIRRKSFLRALPTAIVLLALCGVLVYFSGIIYYLTPAIPANQADMTGGKSFHVKDEITYLYSMYVKETTTRRGESARTSGYGYITLTKDADQFLGLWVKNGDMRIMEQRWDDQDPYLDGTEEGDPAPIPVEGLLRPLTGEDLGYYESTVSRIVDQNEKLSDTDFARYYIDTAAFGFNMWAMAAGAVISLLVALITLIRSRTAGRKAIQNAISNAPDPTAAEASLENFYRNQPEVFKGLRMNEEWFMYLTPTVAQVLRTEDIVWAYRKEIKVRHGLFVSSTTYQAMIYTTKKCHTFPQTKARCDAMLEAVANNAPNAVRGYDDELAKLYKQDPQNFIANAQSWSLRNQVENTGN